MDIDAFTFSLPLLKSAAIGVLIAIALNEIFQKKSI